MKKKIIQTITLVTFIGLIAAFVTYRAGMMDTFIQLSPNGSTINSTSKSDTVKKITIMPSSKVIIMTDEKLRIDSIENDSVSAIEEDLEIMGGSKSGIIFKSDLYPDSTNTKVKKKKRK